MSDSQPEAARDRPVFIVGCQRSGTTLLRLMLDSHSALACGPETLFLSDMERIITTDWHRLARFGFGQDYWLAGIAAFFGGVHADYAAAHGKRRWIDKSPRYALHMDFIARVFPDAQFIHVIRDGRDVAVSHRQRYGYWAALRTTAKWPRYVRAARASATRLPAERYLEVHYEDLVADAQGQLHRVLDFLGEPVEHGLLDFDKKSHDVGSHYHEQFNQRRNAEHTTASVYQSRTGAYKRELDPLTRGLFWVTSRSLLADLGYAGRRTRVRHTRATDSAAARPTPTAGSSR